MNIHSKLRGDGCIDTVIGLPANLFFSTGIPLCILVLKRCKKPDDLPFIKGAKHFEKSKRQNHFLPEHIDKIVSTYQFRTEKPHYSFRVPMDRIVKEGYDLSISRYVRAAADEEIDLGVGRCRARDAGTEDRGCLACFIHEHVLNSFSDGQDCRTRQRRCDLLLSFLATSHIGIWRQRSSVFRTGLSRAVAFVLPIGGVFQLNDTILPRRCS
jgi:hypothetical protein